MKILSRLERDRIVQELIMSALLSNTPLRPGAVIQSFSAEKRQKIRQLTSDDFSPRKDNL